MTQSTTVRAPGKVVILGEYAVLDGAPALVAAVDRGVQVRVTRGPPQHIETPGSDDRFVRPAIEAAAGVGTFRFSAWNPVKAPFKVGLGTSAAATVAAVRASLWAAEQLASDDRVFQIAKSVHHRVQGSGSGIDVAASTYGGVLQYQGQTAQVAPAIELPWTLVWSGTSAQTGPRVQRYQAWQDREWFVQASRELAANFAADPIATVRAARALLHEMAQRADLAYRTAGLDRVAALADTFGGAAKASGAGGGDIAIAIFPDQGALIGFQAQCENEGLPPIHVSVHRIETP